MPGLLPDIDPDGLLEFSVVFTDRSLNHMSGRFQGAMRDISALLKQVYRAEAVAVVPGGGTYAMEAVARQFATGRKCLIVRNGWFSFRWTQILDAGSIASSSVFLKARPVEAGPQPGWAPAPIEEIEAAIARERPDVIFAPHVETSAGMLLSDEYLRRISAAARAVDALFVLDCIASGTLWVDMAATGVDLLISAPQKGWSASPCSGLVRFGPRARERIESTASSSFAVDLKKWLQIMTTYENGGHAYHATMPTDALLQFRDTMLETAAYGFDKVCAEQVELGRQVREMLKAKGYRSVAAPGFEAPGVVVCHTDDPDMQNGSKMRAKGLQIAAGVPLQCDEGPEFRTFRIGLFGLDKLHNPERCVTQLETALG